MAVFNLAKKEEALKNGNLTLKWNSIPNRSSFLKPMFLSLCKAAENYNASHNNKILEGFIWDVRHGVKGQYPMVKENIKGRNTISSSITFNKKSIVVGLALGSTFCDKYEESGKNLAAATANTISKMLVGHSITATVIDYCAKKGLAAQVVLPKFRVTENPNGTIGFKIDTSNLKSINYNDIIDVYLKVRQELLKIV